MNLFLAFALGSSCGSMRTTDDMDGEEDNGDRGCGGPSGIALALSP